MGEGLALGHHPPVLAGEDLVGEGLHRRRPDRHRCRGELLHALLVVLLDRRHPPGDVGEGVAVGGQPEAHAVERGDEVEGLDVAVQRVGAVAHPRDVGRDRRQDVVARDEQPVLGVVEAQMVDGVARGVDAHPLAPGQGDPLGVPDPSGRVGWREQQLHRPDHHATRQLGHRVARPAPGGLAAPRHRPRGELRGGILPQRVTGDVVGVVAHGRDPDVVPRVEGLRRGGRDALGLERLLLARQLVAPS